MKKQNTNKGKIDVYIDNKKIWRRIETTVKVANHFNQDLAAEIKSIKRLMKEADLDIMLIGEKCYREVRQTFQKNLVRG